MSKGPIGVLTRGYRETIDLLIEKLVSARIDNMKLKQEQKETVKKIDQLIPIPEKKIKSVDIYH